VWTIDLSWIHFFVSFRSDVDMLHIYHGDGLMPDPVPAVGRRWDIADKSDNFTLIDIMGYNNFFQIF
jgi:hypothetical protein